MSTPERKDDVGDDVELGEVNFVTGRKRRGSNTNDTLSNLAKSVLSKESIGSVESESSDTSGAVDIEGQLQKNLKRRSAFYKSIRYKNLPCLIRDYWMHFLMFLCFLRLFVI